MTTTVPTLRTRRLVLRPLAASDAESLHTIMQGREVLRYFPVTEPPSRKRVREMISRQGDHWRVHGLGWWAVVERRAESFAGWCGLQHLEETDEIEVAYLLGREFWGRGLGTEAATAAVRYGFGPLALESIIALVHPANQASQRVIEKLGLAWTGQAVYFGMNLDRYMATREQWLASRSPHTAEQLKGSSS